MLKELIEIQSVSGYEEAICDYIKNHIAAYVDSVEVDTLGNLVGFIQGTGESKKKILCAAHMDEIGLQVVKLTSDGFAKVRSLGGVSPVSSYMQRVKFENGAIGIVSNYKKADSIDNKDFTQVYVDFGVNTKEALENIVRIGDVATFVGEYQELAEGRVTGKAFDNRAGCYIQMKSIEALAESRPYHDVYFVFTVQEEVGLKGARVISEHIKPDIGIAVDITGSFDVPGDMDGAAVMGKGAAIKISDASVICDRILVEQMRLCAMENKISHQMDIMTGGGTDAGAINVSGTGVKALGISIPTRYGHSPNNIICKDDLKACHELMTAFLKQPLK